LAAPIAPGASKICCATPYYQQRNPEMNLLELERETTKMTRVIMTRHIAIGKDPIADMRTRMTLE